MKGFEEFGEDLGGVGERGGGNRAGDDEVVLSGWEGDCEVEIIGKIVHSTAIVVNNSL